MLVSAVTNAFQQGVSLWEFVGKAGERMDENNKRGQGRRRKGARVVSCPEEADEAEFERRVDEYDDAAISFHAGKDYMTAGEHDDALQRHYLMALDCMDSIGPYMRLLNTSRARPSIQPWNAQLGNPNCC